MALATVEKKESKRVRNMTFLKMQNVQLQLTLIFFISLIMYKYKLASEQQAARRRSAGAFKR